MKIAFLVPTKVQNNNSGVHVIKDITCLLNSLPNIDVTIFSIGKKDESIKIKTYYKEIVSKSSGFIGNNNILIKLLDYLSLLVLKRSYSYFIRNSCSALIGKIVNYDPDIIITSYEFSDFITHYRRYNKKIRIIALMDDPRQLNDFINSKLVLIKNKTFLYKIYRFGVKIVAHNYLQMLKKKYSELVKNAIFVINFTAEGSKISKKIYKRYSGKFLVIPPPLTINIKSTYKLKVKRYARNILFLGSCNYSPNKEAIQLIENNIAPKLPEFNFILVGKNCRKYESGNIKSFGHIAHINKILDKSDMCIAPIIHGGGIKTKLLDYIAACKPIIGTSLAFEGYPIKDGINAVIEDDIDRYAERIRLLAKSYRLRKEITKNTLKIIPYFSNDKFIKRWTTLFNKAMLIT